MSELPSLIDYVAILAAFSASTERAVELLKGCIPWLNTSRMDPNEEERRKLAIQAVGVVCGALTAYLGREFLPMHIRTLADTPGGATGLGLLLSGGSGFWNAVLGYLRGIKDGVSIDAQRKRETLAGLKSASTTLDPQIRCKC